MFLNDAFDADFDRQRRTERPIPSGKISPVVVWAFGWAWLGLGILLLLFLGKVAGALAVVLAACIVIYNATHKAITASPWLMGACRFWVYVIAGTTGANGLNGWPIWCGAALAFYIVGLSYVARRESFRGTVPFWPLIFLAAPIFLAMLMNAGARSNAAIWISLVLALWIARCVRTDFSAGRSERRADRFRFAGGNRFCGLAGGRAAMSPRIERGVFNSVRLDALAATIRSGDLT